MELDRLFIDCSSRRLILLLSRIQDCVSRLSPGEIWARGHENENAIGNLILHLGGNVRQWIISGVGGVPDTRMRDAEFEARALMDTSELMSRLEATVKEAIQVIDGVTAEGLAKRVTIQKYDVTVLEAIYHVVEHFSHHTGQIIFATKMLTGEDLRFYKHLSASVHAEKTP
jgi:uncharacterized damage-inducible protein DinB